MTPSPSIEELLRQRREQQEQREQEATEVDFEQIREGRMTSVAELELAIIHAHRAQELAPIQHSPRVFDLMRAAKRALIEAQKQIVEERKAQSSREA